MTTHSCSPSPATFTTRRGVRRAAAFAVTVAALLGGPGHAAWAADEPRAKPNIVIILADDLGPVDLGCYGSTFHRTPNLDQMARQGLRFTSAYASAPVCSPTRAAILTGKAPARLRLTDWLPGRKDSPDQPLARPAFEPQLPLSETTLAEALGKAGYAAGHVGKWHLGGPGFEPEKQGFLPDPESVPRQGSRAAVKTDAERALVTDRLTADAERFLERHQQQPFFLYLCYYAPHIPLVAKPELVAQYPNRPTPGRQSNPIYAAMLQNLDEGVGRVLKKLDDLRLSERTLVLFLSDNGGLCTLEGPNTPATINSPWREGKGYLYEGGLRTPLLARWPGVIAPGGQTDAPVVTHDLFRTALELAGAAEGNGASGNGAVGDETGGDGVSFAPLLKGGPPPQRKTLFWHYPHYSNQGGKPGGAVREGDLKLIEFYEDGRRELYNLKTDRGESRNIAGDAPQTVARLGDALAAWRRSVGAQMPAPNPGYRPGTPDKEGAITLPAHLAQVHGNQLRYEPLPHKNTLGYWVRAEDWASFAFTVEQPGTYALEAWQGCGGGQGGSVVEFSAAKQVLSMTVEDTGGFQNFKPRVVGQFTFSAAGRFTLEVRAKSKAKAAVMDLQKVVLRRVGG